jgi:hypothetical protein
MTLALTSRLGAAQQEIPAELPARDAALDWLRRSGAS